MQQGVLVTSHLAAMRQQDMSRFCQNRCRYVTNPFSFIFSSRPKLIGQDLEVGLSKP